jgi:hypothetical protein
MSSRGMLCQHPVSKEDCNVLFKIYRKLDLHGVTRVACYARVAQPDWGYFEWTEQIISIIPYTLIQTFFAMILKNIFIFSKRVYNLIEVISSWSEQKLRSIFNKISVHVYV